MYVHMSKDYLWMLWLSVLKTFCLYHWDAKGRQVLWFSSCENASFKPREVNLSASLEIWIKVVHRSRSNRWRGVIALFIALWFCTSQYSSFEFKAEEIGWRYFMGIGKITTLATYGKLSNKRLRYLVCPWINRTLSFVRIFVEDFLK